MFSLFSISGKDLLPIALAGALGLGVYFLWRQIAKDQANADASAEAANTYGGGPATTVDANTALINAMFAGATPDQNGLPAPGTQVTYSSPAPPLAQPGALPVTLSGPSTSQGL